MFEVGARLLVLATLLVSLHPVESLSKCCPDGLALKVNQRENQVECVKVKNTAPFNNDRGKLQGKKLQKYIDSNDKAGLPRCNDHTALNISMLEESLLKKTDGSFALESDHYRNEITEFCMDTDETNLKAWAVACDPCGGNKPCVHRCCPFGQLIYEGNSCEDSSDSEVNVTFYNDLTLTTGGHLKDLSQDMSWLRREEFVSWTEDDQYVFKHTPAPELNCPVAGDYFQMTEIPGTAITTKGELIVVGLDIPPVKSGQFCVSNFEENGTVYTDYLICYIPRELDKCEKIAVHYYKAGSLISLFFVALTIVVQFWDRSRQGTITYTMNNCFIVNLFMFYLVVTIEKFAEFESGTTSCTVMAYLIQYFFLSFFTWINANAIQCWVTFKWLMRSLAPSKKPLYLYVLYGQGFPLVISIVTAVLDSKRPDDYTKDYFPNMGVYSCFPGRSIDSADWSYFVSPDFIYLQVWIMAQLLVNMILFPLTAYTIIKQRNQATKARTESQDNSKKNLLIVMKLYVIMVFFWACDIATTILSYEQGEAESACARIALDTANLLYGLAVFLVLSFSRFKRKIQDIRRSTKDSDGSSSVSTAKTGRKMTNITEMSSMS